MAAQYPGNARMGVWNDKTNDTVYVYKNIPPAVCWRSNAAYLYR